MYGKTINIKNAFPNDILTDNHENICQRLDTGKTVNSDSCDLVKKKIINLLWVD